MLQSHSSCPKFGPRTRSSGTFVEATLVKATNKKAHLKDSSKEALPHPPTSMIAIKMKVVAKDASKKAIPTVLKMVPSKDGSKEAIPANPKDTDKNKKKFTVTRAYC